MSILKDDNKDKKMNKKMGIYWADKERIKRSEEIRKQYKEKEVK